MLPKCTCYAAQAQKQHFNQIARLEQDRKEQVQDLRIDWILDWHKNLWSTDLD
jgi:hypothetical protein